MSTKKVSTTKKTPSTKKTNVATIVSESTFTDVKEINGSTNVTIMNKQSQLNDLLSKVEKLENLRKYYGKLKVKRNTLEDALKKMSNKTTNKDDQFEEESIEKFPFEIVLKGIGEYNREEELFKISKRETVTNFTKYLLKQINDLIEVFETDLIDEARNGF